MDDCIILEFGGMVVVGGKLMSFIFLATLLFEWLNHIVCFSWKTFLYETTEEII